MKLSSSKTKFEERCSNGLSSFRIWCFRDPTKLVSDVAPWAWLRATKISHVVGAVPYSKALGCNGPFIALVSAVVAFTKPLISVRVAWQLGHGWHKPNTSHVTGAAPHITSTCCSPRVAHARSRLTPSPPPASPHTLPVAKQDTEAAGTRWCARGDAAGVGQERGARQPGSRNAVVVAARTALTADTTTASPVCVHGHAHTQA